MYKIEDATFEEYEAMVPVSIEMGTVDEEELKSCHIVKGVCDKKTFCLVADKEFEFEDYKGKKFLLVSGVLSKECGKHVRFFLTDGKKYLDSIQKVPLVALANSKQPRYIKFLKALGFVDTFSIVEDKQNGIIYNIYVRY